VHASHAEANREAIRLAREAAAESVRGDKVAVLVTTEGPGIDSDLVFHFRVTVEPDPI